MEIIKYKDETIVNEIFGQKRIPYKDNNLHINKKDSEFILFSFDEKISFLGNKRKRNSDK